MVLARTLLFSCLALGCSSLLSGPAIACERLGLQVWQLVLRLGHAPEAEDQVHLSVLARGGEDEMAELFGAEQYGPTVGAGRLHPGQHGRERLARAPRHAHLV